MAQVTHSTPDDFESLQQRKAPSKSTVSAVISRFLAGDIRFTDIPRLVGDVLERMPHTECDSLDAVFAADSQARSVAREWS